MEIEVEVTKKKDLYSSLISFIETSDDSDSEFMSLIEILDKQAVLEKKEEIQLLFQLISKIADNHHISSDFFIKLDNLFQYLIKEKQSKLISDFIPDYKEYNKRVLFYLLEKGFLIPDQLFLDNFILKENQETFSKDKFKEFDHYYFYPAIKQFIDKDTQKQIETEIFQKYEESIENFYKKCQIGENDSYVCSLIRQDLVEEFISYVNRTNLSLSSTIGRSTFETNSFLKDMNPSLIEYSAFYGSIQIFQYLQFNHVQLPGTLWLYAIHSNNAELIHILESHKLKPPEPSVYNNYNDFYKSVLIESIKCHHNDISNYIIDNLIEIKINENAFYEIFELVISNSFNFHFFPNDFSVFISKNRNNKGFKISRFLPSLASITIPSSVKSIGEYAFSNCSYLTQVTIPSSVTEIRDFAFSECPLLTRISILSSSISIGKFVFDKVNNIVDFNINTESIPMNLFSGYSLLKQITITSPIKSICENSFSGCCSLTRFDIPSTVTRIESGSFNKCKSLKEITFPSSIEFIGENSFEGCSSLLQISIPSSVNFIGENAFGGCSSLTRISILSSIDSINDFTFCECSSLTEISIPSSVRSIGRCCFFGCLLLSQIEIPSSVTVIESSAFEKCKSLTKISIPSSVTIIGDYTFSECLSLKTISISSSVTSIGEYCFSECSLLEEIELPSSLSTLKRRAFNRCSALKKVRIPENVNSIGDRIFTGCSSLEQINVPSTLKIDKLGQCSNVNVTKY